MKSFRAALAVGSVVISLCACGCANDSEDISSLPAAVSVTQETSGISSSADTYFSEEQSVSADTSASETEYAASGSDDEEFSETVPSAEMSSADVTGITGNSSDTEISSETSSVTAEISSGTLSGISSAVTSETSAAPVTTAATVPVQTTAATTTVPVTTADTTQLFDTIPTLPTEEEFFPQADESVQTETLAVTEETSRGDSETDGKKKKIVYMTYQEFFSKSLFVGDSICSGLKVYGGLLPTENVAARINVSTWGIEKYTFQYMTNSKAELGAYAIAELYQPEDIYIWMGMNDLYVVSEDKFCENLSAIADKFLEVSPDSTIHVLSISPMTAGHKWNVELGGNDRVNLYNAAAEKYCAESDKLDWINIHDELIDANGYLASENNGGDGLHLSASAYKKVLNKVVNHKLGKDEQNAAEKDT